MRHPPTLARDITCDNTVAVQHCSHTPGVFAGNAPSIRHTVSFHLHKARKRGTPLLPSRACSQEERGCKSCGGFLWGAAYYSHLTASVRREPVDRHSLVVHADRMRSHPVLWTGHWRSVQQSHSVSSAADWVLSTRLSPTHKIACDLIVGKPRLRGAQIHRCLQCGRPVSRAA